MYMTDDFKHVVYFEINSSNIILTCTLIIILKETSMQKYSGVILMDDISDSVKRGSRPGRW